MKSADGSRFILPAESYLPFDWSVTDRMVSLISYKNGSKHFLFLWALIERLCQIKSDLLIKISVAC